METPKVSNDLELDNNSIKDLEYTLTITNNYISPFASYEVLELIYPVLNDLLPDLKKCQTTINSAIKRLSDENQ